MFLFLQTAADQIAENYHNIMGGRGPLTDNVVDKAAGY
jgi:hypothetical protein